MDEYLPNDESTLDISAINETALLNSLVDSNKEIDSERITSAADRLREIFQFSDGNAPDLVVLLGGGVQRTVDPEDSSRLIDTSPGFRGVDNNGLSSGSIYRVISGAIASKLYPQADIETNSGNFPDEESDCPAIVMRNELKRLGVDSNIIVESNSLSTIGNIVELIRLLNSNDWAHVAIITNEYHVPRVQEMLAGINNFTFPEEQSDVNYLQALEKIREDKVQLKIVGCESVLAGYDNRFSEAYSIIKNSEMYKKRLALEEHGVRQLKGIDPKPYQRNPKEHKVVKKRYAPNE